MNHLILKLKQGVQVLVDKYHGKTIDKIAYAMYLLLLVGVIHVSWLLIKMIETPRISATYSPTFYALLILMPIALFYFTTMGNYLKKPSRRLQQFIFSITTTAIFAMGYIAQVSNVTFINLISGIKNIEAIPYEMLEGNIRMTTFLFPLTLILPIFFLTFKVVVDKNYRKQLIEYEVELLLPNVHKMDDTTIDIKICENIETGEECIVPEKKLYEHIWLQGGTGSGKTSTGIKPILEQLFNKKNHLINCQKKLAFEALEEGIAHLTAPVTDLWFNSNFTMDLIKPLEGKEKEFKEKFKNFIIGVRDKEELLLNSTFHSNNVYISKPLSSDIYNFDITILKNGLDYRNQKVSIKHDEFIEEINFEGIVKVQFSYDQEDSLNKDDREMTPDRILSLINDEPEQIHIRFPTLEEGYEYKVTVTKRGTGDIIYKNLGVTVVAPDGGLPEDTIKIANQNKVKIHKIDPKMEEIAKGGVAKFNPLLGGRPEKTGDIISSILVSMEQADGEGSKSYFVNASVRAVRNTVILLKVMYPRLYGYEPTLEDVLDILQNFNLVVPIVERMKEDEVLKRKWRAVIDYFETSFYPPEVDDKGKVIIGGTIGSQRRKTEEAIGGVINQLDNFLGREEIKHILCDRRESLDLAKVLEKGECIAIATRQNELGQKLGKAFALFFILSLQNEVLSRYSETENPEVPHFLLIDEFPFYVNDATKIFFTFARKYKCSVLIAIQNMGQLKEVSDTFGETIFTNTSTKILMPKSNVEDRKYWSEFFGTEERFEYQTGVTTNSIMNDNPNYSEQVRGTIKPNQKVSEQEINDLNFKQTFYSYTNAKERQKVGKGLTDFKTDNKIAVKDEQYNFEAYSPNESRVEVSNKKNLIETPTDNATPETMSESILEVKNDKILPVNERMDLQVSTSETTKENNINSTINSENCNKEKDYNVNFVVVDEKFDIDDVELELDDSVEKLIIPQVEEITDIEFADINSNENDEENIVVDLEAPENKKDKKGEIFELKLDVELNEESDESISSRNVFVFMEKQNPQGGKNEEVEFIIEGEVPSSKTINKG